MARSCLDLRMGHYRNVWMIANAASGSNSPAALEQVRGELREHALTVERTVCLPQDSLPTAAGLDAEEVELVVAYAGDGTVNAVLRQVKGWSGAVLVLPGGTMNLLSRRLHGPQESAAIIAVVADGGARRCRLNIVRCAHGEAYAGLLAGPGTRWGVVREAMREFDVMGMASGAAEALSESTNGAMLRAITPALGQREGYPLIEMTPGEHGLQIDGFHARSVGEFAQQGWALLRRRFREGPHDRLGIVDEVTLQSVDGTPIDLLLDGEPAQGGTREIFTVSTNEVDLLATGHG